jgi:hypothetical protein
MLASDGQGDASVPGREEETRDAASTLPEGYRGELPPPLAPPPRTRWTAVERPDELIRTAAALRGSTVLAIDAEFVQVRVRGPEDPSHRLALLQLAAMPGAEGAYVVDPLRLTDLSPLEAPLQDGGVVKLFHGSGADTRVLATRGLVARHTLDLEAVSRSIFGQRESSLQAMLLRACGVRLDKSLQRSDWTRRPLTPAMLAYAARDAEMTLVLYTWLAAHYPWAIALHEVPEDEAAPAVAAWVRPFLEGSRPQRVEWAVAEAGLEGNLPAQVEALRRALVAVHRPGQRARVMRMISDLDLTLLAADLHPLLASPAVEERAGAARALGRLRDMTAEPALRALLNDAVQDVRQAAQVALQYLSSGPPTPGTAVTRGQQGTGTSWTVGEPSADGPVQGGWQAALRARFANLHPSSAADTAAAAEDRPGTDPTTPDE